VASSRDTSATALAGAAVSTAIPTESTAAAFGNVQVAPADKLRFGVIGCKGMGWSDMRAHLTSMQEVDCVALADIDQSVLDERSNDVFKLRGNKPQTFKDYRKMLEMKDLDAVIIGTPDHWHCLGFTDSLAAGKHVYCEKPISANIEECNVMLRAARRYPKLMVQVGQWHRSRHRRTRMTTSTCHQTAPRWP
jgi:predicted dehydrogenase